MSILIVKVSFEDVAGSSCADEYLVEYHSAHVLTVAFLLVHHCNAVCWETDCTEKYGDSYFVTGQIKMVT